MSDPTIGIVGLGYVGRELAESCLGIGLTVHGVDNDPDVLESIYIESKHNPLYDNLHVLEDYSSLTDVDIIIFCLPTPLANKLPNHSILLDSIGQAVDVARDGTLLIIESTVGIGITDFISTALIGDRDLLLAFSPERINPGSDIPYAEVPKIVSGVGNEARDKAASFYRLLVDEVVVANSTQEAEASKLLENAYRMINIAFINEFAKKSRSLGIDPENVINLASTKPFGFQAFYPSAGVGGHCIPVDPVFLQQALGYMPTLNAAMISNSHMTVNILERVMDILGDLAGKKVAICGMAYKPDVNDTRNSQGSLLYEALVAMGAVVSTVDPVVELNEKVKKGTDLAIVVVEHTTPYLIPEDTRVLNVSRGL